MNKEFLLVHKDIIPPFFEDVIKAREKIEGENRNISDVCKELGISRSTYYKYKDKVFYVGVDYGKKAIIGFKTQNVKGVLSAILNTIASENGNVLTISQDMPIHNLAHITVAIDTKELTDSLSVLVKKLSAVNYVKKVELIAFE